MWEVPPLSILTFTSSSFVFNSPLTPYPAFSPSLASVSSIQSLLYKCPHHRSSSSYRPCQLFAPSLRSALCALLSALRSLRSALCSLLSALSLRPVLWCARLARLLHPLTSARLSCLSSAELSDRSARLCSARLARLSQPLTLARHPGPARLGCPTGSGQIRWPMVVDSVRRLAVCMLLVVS
jgi:hypothetical protein